MSHELEQKWNELRATYEEEGESFQFRQEWNKFRQLYYSECECELPSNRRWLLRALSSPLPPDCELFPHEPRDEDEA